MSLDKAIVARIATLARLKTDEAELTRMVGELNGILKWIEQLNEVDVTGVEPMTAVVEHVLPWRDDVANDGGYADRILANAPDAVRQVEGGFFTVPKVVE